MKEASKIRKAIWSREGKCFDQVTRDLINGDGITLPEPKMIKTNKKFWVILGEEIRNES